MCTKAITLIGVATVTSLLAPLAADTARGAPVKPTTDNVSELVDSYEQHQTFRGINNAMLPATAADGFRLGDVTIRVDTDGHGVDADGYFNYGSLDDHATIIAASDGNKMDRFGIVITEGGNDTYRLDADVPEGATVDHTGAGTIEVTTASGETTTLAPALAVDADGSVLMASYRLYGGEMVVTVDLDDAEFPVIVDPVSANYWWGHQTWLSISDVRRQADWWGVTKVIKQVCNRLWGPAKWACSATAGKYANWVYGKFQFAKNNGRCLWYKQAWTGQIWSIDTYSCNWR